MIQIHQAREGELAAAGALWADTFGDGPDVQRDFYRLCGPGGPLVLTEDGRSIERDPGRDILLPSAQYFGREKPSPAKGARTKSNRGREVDR